MQYAIVLAAVILVQLILVILFFTKAVSRDDCLFLLLSYWAIIQRINLFVYPTLKCLLYALFN